MQLEQLPTDVLFLIISHVPYKELRYICATSKQFAQLGRAERHFQARFKNEYPTAKKAAHLSYQQIYQMCKRFETGRAKLISVPEEIYPEWEECELESEDMVMLNEKVLPYVRERRISDRLMPSREAGIASIKRLMPSREAGIASIKRGDVIHLEIGGDYRNDGKYIYDGEKIVQLGYKADQYGAVPPQFKVLDDDLNFSATYWLEVINHNRLVYWDTRPYLDQLEQNMKPMQIVEEKIGKHIYESYAIQTSFHHLTGIKFTISFSMDVPCTKKALIAYLQVEEIFTFDEDNEDNPYNISFYISKRHLDKFGD